MTPREQWITRKNCKQYSLKLTLNQNTNQFLCQNTPSANDEEGRPVLVENRPVIINEGQRAKEARKKRQRQRKYRNKQLKGMSTIITKLKLNNERQKYKRIKKKVKGAQEIG